MAECANLQSTYHYCENVIFIFFLHQALCADDSIAHLSLAKCIKFFPVMAKKIT